MTVKEVIETLQTFPQDLPCEVYNGTWDMYEEVLFIRLDQENKTVIIER